MKKSYLMIAAAAALFAACSDTEKLNEVVNEQLTDQPLAFSAYADKVLKGTNSTALNDFYTTFGVYGWKTVNGAVQTPAVFENEINEYFTADGNGTTVYDGTDEKPSKEWAVPATFVPAWYYENVRYWDKTASSYEFFAIAPYEATATYSVTAGASNISIATAATPYNISNEKNLAIAGNPAVPQATLSYSGFTKDYMIADKVTVNPKTRTPNTAVDLVFHHILTKLNVKIQKAGSYKGQQTLQVNKLEIANLASKANFTYTTSMTTDGWTEATKTGEGNNYSLKVETAYALNGTTNYNECYWIEALIFPQTTNCKAADLQSSAENLSDCYLYIQYQIGNEVYNAYYDLAYVFDNTLAPVAATYYTAAEAAAYNEENNLTDADDGYKHENDLKTDAIPGGDYSFNQGSQYNLTLTVGPEPIYFDATVTPWVTETAVSHDVD